MSRDFPLPRDLIPEIHLSEHDHQTCKDFTARLLRHTVREFEHFAYDGLDEVDPKLWRTQATRDELALYRERHAGSVSETLGDMLHRCAAVSPLFSSTAAALTPATMMLTGLRHGHVENALTTLVTTTQEELALVVRYLHGASSDCGVLHTMESPTPEDPFHFLGVKFYVSQAVGDPRLLKRRHCVYLEDSGFTQTRTGEKLGYHIMHSVELPQFPSLRSRNSIPALMSMRFLYRQREEGIVEVFMLGNIDIKGLAIKPIAQHFAAETAFNMTLLFDCSETKRLTQMARSHLLRKHMARRLRSPQESDELLSSSAACNMCERVAKDSGFKAFNLVECLICGRVACPRCRRSKQVFVNSQDGLLGQLIMVPACKGCILTANTSFFEAQPQVATERRTTPHFGRERSRDSSKLAIKRRSGSSRAANVILHTPSADRRRRMTTYWGEDVLSPSTPSTQVWSPERCVSARQTWVATPRGTSLIRLTPREGSLTIEERKPLRRPKTAPPPRPRRGPPQLTRYKST